MAKPAKQHPCKVCDGVGEVRAAFPSGRTDLTERCRHCKGRGFYVYACPDDACCPGREMP